MVVKTFKICEHIESILENGVIGDVGPKVQRSSLPYWKAIVASINICMGSMAIGTVYAFPSPSFPKMNSEPNPFHLSLDEQSWAVGAVSFGGLFGGLSGRFLVDSLGRKLSLIMAMTPLSLGWLVILSSQYPWMVIFGRSLTGLAVGVTWVCSPIYVAEIAPAAHRGLLLMLHAFLLSFGVVWTYIIGEFFSWTWLVVSYLAFSVIGAAGLVFIPESPRWLLLKGYPEAAEYSLKWYRGVNNVADELNAIKDNIKSTSQESIQLREILTKQFYYPLLLTLGLVTVQIWGGISVIDAYTVDIFRSGGTAIDPYLATTIIGLVQFVGNFYMFYLMDRAGRRPMLIVSGVGMTISLVAMAVFFKIKSINQSFADEYLYWLPIASIVLYFLTFDLGWSPIPPAMIGELLPIRTRGLAGGITVAWAWISIFLTTKFYVNIVTTIGEFGAFIIYSGFTVAGVFFAYFILPETKNKTLEEIEKSFQRNSDSNVH